MSTPPSLGSLLRHHIATPAAPYPPAGPGIAWIWAADGIYKLGSASGIEILVPVGPRTPPVPGLARLFAAARWKDYSHRLPGQLLAAMLTHARKAASVGGQGVLRPIEAQYHVTLEAERLRVRVPPQDATPARVTYEPPQGVPVLLDLHSHHGMPAFFSSTDNRDDTGLGVSAVVGNIFTEPEIAVRLCCYSHTLRVPALTIFDSLPGCRDTYGDRHAEPRD